MSARAALAPEASSAVLPAVAAATPARDLAALPSRRADGRDDLPLLSCVIAVYNEHESLRPLYAELVAALEALPFRWEVIFCDDGSTDGSRAIERDICARDPRFRAIQLRRNFGKSAALTTGFRAARGEVICTLDADLQDDPGDIADLVHPILRGESDLVTGWKFPRRDPITKRWPSKVYNAVTRIFTGVALHDMNCGLKAYRTDVVREMSLYGDMHRYIPVLAVGNGFVVSECKVHHRPRVHGYSKFGGARFLRGFFDLVTVLFLTKYRRRPLHMIGTLGFVVGSAGMLILLYLTVLKLAGHAIGGRPLLLLGALLILVSGQFFTFGLLAEMITFYQHRDSNEYPVVARYGFENGPNVDDTGART